MAQITSLAVGDIVSVSLTVAFDGTQAVETAKITRIDGGCVFVAVINTIGTHPMALNYSGPVEPEAVLRVIPGDFPVTFRDGGLVFIG